MNKIGMKLNRVEEGDSRKKTTKRGRKKGKKGRNEVLGPVRNGIGQVSHNRLRGTQFDKKPGRKSGVWPAIEAPGWRE